MSDGYIQFTSRSGKTHTRRDNVNYDNILKEEQATSDAQAGRYAEEANAANDRYKESMNRSYNTALAARQQAADEDIQKSGQQYDSLFDVNRAQQLASERNLREQMANAGMTNSGWNATNQTAITATRANADAKVRLQKQNAVDAILREMREYAANLEMQKAQAAAEADRTTSQGILQNRQSVDNAARQYANSRYGTALDEQQRENAWRDQWEQQDYADEVAAQKYADQMKQQQYENEFSERKYADQLKQQQYENNFSERKYADTLKQQQYENNLSERKYADQMKQQQYENNLSERKLSLSASSGSGSGKSSGLSYPKVYDSAVQAAAKMTFEENEPTRAADALYNILQQGGTELTEAQFRDMCAAAGVSADAIFDCVRNGVSPSKRMEAEEAAEEQADKDEAFRKSEREYAQKRARLLAKTK